MPNNMIYIYIAIFAVIAAIITFIIMTIIEKRMNKKREQQYLAVMKEDNPSIVDGLKKARNLYKRKSQEWIAIDKAIFHLTRSMFKDYYTAFFTIEKVFKSQETKELHEKIILSEQTKMLPPI